MSKTKRNSWDYGKAGRPQNGVLLPAFCRVKPSPNGIDGLHNPSLLE
jgi:hypothetical protein